MTLMNKQRQVCILPDSLLLTARKDNITTGDIGELVKCLTERAIDEIYKHMNYSISNVQIADL